MCSFDTKLNSLYELSNRNTGLLTKSEKQTLLCSGAAREGFGGPVPVTTILGGDPSTLGAPDRPCNRG